MVDTLIAVIGAGLSGVGMAVQLKRRLGLDCNDFVIYEKTNEVGGTWSQNIYPNLSCDVPSEFYSYSFFQNPDWSEKFASQPEILAYIKQCISHFAIDPALRLGQECLRISWAKDSSLWHLDLHDTDTGKRYTRTAKFVVTAMGVFNVPRGLQDLPMLKDLDCPVFHTAEWRDIDFEHKRVFVIGNGCSANQVIPWVLSHGNPSSVTQLVRSEQWVAPKGNFKHSVWFQRVLRYVPFVMRIYRLWTAWQLDAGFVGFRKNAAGDRARASVTENICQYMMAAAAPQYHDILIPKYPFGAKRPVVDHGYLESTNRENFRLIKSEAPLRVGDDKRTLIDGNGEQHKVDIVIMANGFQTQDLLAPIAVHGLPAQDLRGRWQAKGGAEAYMGVAVSGFPNLFLIGGPNSLPSLNSTLHGLECSIIYITRLLQGLRQRGNLQSTTLQVRAEKEKEFNENLQQEIGKLIYSNVVSTWYINKETGKNTLVWPGTQVSFWWSRCIESITWSDWQVQN